jgi:hypothetical protein
VWIVIAAVAMLISLVLLLLPHAHDAGAVTAWFLLFPVLFIGVIEPVALLSRLAWVVAALVPCAPVPAASFQRPPPCQLA